MAQGRVVLYHRGQVMPTQDVSGHDAGIAHYGPPIPIKEYGLAHGVGAQVLDHPIEPDHVGRFIAFAAIGLLDHLVNGPKRAYPFPGAFGHPAKVYHSSNYTGIDH